MSDSVDSLDSLLKLTQTKSADGKTTVLDYLVEDVFIAKGQRQKLDLTSDFPECSTAGRMLIGDLVAEVKAMQDSLSQCNSELEALRKEANGKSGGVNSAIAKIESQDCSCVCCQSLRGQACPAWAEMRLMSMPSCAAAASCSSRVTAADTVV